MTGVQLQHGSRSKASCRHIPVQDAVSGRNTHHLLSGHAHRLDAELAVAHVEQVLETRPREVDDEDIMEPFLPEVVYLGYPRCCPSPTHTGNIDVVVRRMQSKTGEKRRRYARHPANIR